MDRELLLEIGVEEMPASWLPALTAQLAERLQARLTEARVSRRDGGRVAFDAAAAGGVRRRSWSIGRKIGTTP